MVSEQLILGMVNTGMENRVDQLEEVVIELQRKQGETTEKLTGVEGTVRLISDQLTELRNLITVANRDIGRIKDGHIEGEKVEEPRNISTSHGERNERGEEETRQNDNKHFRRLELPIFNGDDPLGWMFRVECYLTINKISKQDKLDAAIVSLKGKALTWF